MLGAVFLSPLCKKSLMFSQVHSKIFIFRCEVYQVTLQRCFQISMGTTSLSLPEWRTSVLCLSFLWVHNQPILVKPMFSDSHVSRNGVFSLFDLSTSYVFHSVISVHLSITTPCYIVYQNQDQQWTKIMVLEILKILPVGALILHYHNGHTESARKDSFQTH